MDLSIILPIRNERENLVPLIHELSAVLSGLKLTSEIILVDDASTDGTRVLIAELVARMPFVRAIFLRQHSGQTAAFDAGFRHASGRVVATMDADGQNDPADLPRLLAKLDEGFDCVCGIRRKRRDRLVLRRFPSYLANCIIRRVMNSKLSDLGCSLRVYRKQISDEFRLYGEMHRFIGVLAEQLGARVAELEVNHRARIAGRSNYGLERIFKVLVDLITIWFLKRYHNKPAYFFAGIGSGFIATGLITLAWVLYEKYYLKIWVHKNPWFLLAVLGLIVGVHFVAMGLIAEIIVRTYYESQNKAAYSISKLLGFQDTSSNFVAMKQRAKDT